VRRRLVLSTLAVAVVAVVLLGVPLAVAGAIVRLDLAGQEVQARADSIGRAVDDAHSEGRPVTRRLVLDRLPPVDSAIVRLRAGETMTYGVAPEGRYLEGRYESAAVEVLVRRDRSTLRGDITRVVLLVITVAIVALLAALGVALFQARRLTRPMEDLARTAGWLGVGASRPTFERSGIEEVDRVAEVLEHSNERITSILAAERQFASDASHQLRTPLTALSMRLEEIAESPSLDGVREEAHVALTQVERLAGVVDHLLASSRESRSAGVAVIAVDEVVDQQAAEWRPSFKAARRRLEIVGETGTRAVATRTGFSQVLATLLENSLVHGGGAVTVTVRRSGKSVVVQVADEGPGVPAELAPRIFERFVTGGTGGSSTGLGLALARDLAEADGGRLELVRQVPATFALFLGAAGSAPGSGPGAGPAAPRHLAGTDSGTSAANSAGNTQRR
jgi:signal transduction histidine kinase